MLKLCAGGADTPCAGTRVFMRISRLCVPRRHAGAINSESEAVVLRNLPKLTRIGKDAFRSVGTLSSALIVPLCARTVRAVRELVRACACVQMQA